MNTLNFRGAFRSNNLRVSLKADCLWSVLVLPATVAASDVPMATASLQRCNDPMIIVEALDKGLAERICRVAVAAKAYHETCHLKQSRPVTIAVVDELLTGRQSGFISLYRPQKDRIELTHPNDVTHNLSKDSVYRNLQPDHLYDSLIVHEMTHALLAKTYLGLQLGIAGHEYIAYALQLELMPAKTRQILLDAYPPRFELEFGAFDETYLARAPVRFATNAWRHFSMAGHGCTFIQKIIEGDVEFPSNEELAQ